MKTPERSAAIAKALASESDGLPADFAARVAAAAEEIAAARRSWWNEIALALAFVAMIGVCVVGWFGFAAQESGSVEWFEPLISAAMSQPLLIIGIAGIAIVQALTFRRRV
jgi:hypothetical protein